MALADNLVAYWKLDANGNDAKWTNHWTISWATSDTTNYKIVSAYLFDAATETMSLSTATLNNAAMVAGTISFWVRPTASGSATDNTSEMIISKWNIYQSINFQSDDKFSYFYYGSDASSNYIRTNAVSLNNWHHIVVTWDSTGTTIYRDNNADATTVWWTGKTPTNINTTNNTQACAIWNNNASNRWPVTWTYDEIGIWSRKLSATEVWYLYNSWNWLAYPLVPSVTTWAAFLWNMV